jgi:hypothetical protein
MRGAIHQLHHTHDRYTTTLQTLHVQFAEHALKHDCCAAFKHKQHPQPAIRHVHCVSSVLMPPSVHGRVHCSEFKQNLKP